MNNNHCIAYFVSPHGFGHAARAAAVMEAIHCLDPAVRFILFTKVPRWFFERHRFGYFEYRDLLTDIGFVQASPLQFDLAETVRKLDRLMPYDPGRIGKLVAFVKERGCVLVLCDISPLGIAVAREAGIPSVLIENFTWDWLYAPYEQETQGLSRHAAYMRDLFNRAHYRIQTKPVCDPMGADLETRPVSRKTRTSARETRKKLGLEQDEKLVMVTMGGIPASYDSLEQLKRQKGIRFLIPGTGNTVRQDGNLLLLPHDSPYFHPDLVNAADAVIGKAGYSTLAEVYNSGVPFGYVTRENFRESGVLVTWIESEMKGIPISERDFHEGRWLADTHRLVEMPRVHRVGQQGAEQAARFLVNLLHSGYG